MFNQKNSKKIITQFIFVGIAFFLLNGLIFPQEHLATLSGTVVDEEENPLPGATIVVKSMETGYEYSAVTRPNGQYTISGIQPRTYDISVSMQLFVTKVMRGVVFNVGAKLTINFKLKMSALEEEIEVTAEAPLVEVTKSEISSVVDHEKIDSLPLLERDFSSLTILTTGSQEGRSNAQPEGSAEYIVDGVSNEYNTRNKIRANIPADAIQEFRVITNQYAAEYGNASGMILNAITKSGTNEFKGRFSTFFRDEVFDAKNYFAEEKEDFSQYRFGGFLGGPIKKDKTHFFFAYEGLRHTEYSVITSPLVPRESVPIKANNDQFLFKLSHRFNEKNLLSFRYSRDWPRTENEGVGGLRTRERALNVKCLVDSIVGNWTFFPSNNTMNELRFQYSKGTEDYSVENPENYTINRPSGYFGSDAWNPQTFDETRYQIIDNFSIFLNNHSIKLGFDLNFIKLDGNLWQNYPGEYEFTTDEPFDPNVPDTYPFMFIYVPRIIDLKTPVRNYGFFIQDSWKVHPRLTLNLGLRYNWYYLEDMNLDNYTLKSFNPRFGFSWDPLGDGKTSVRGGIGTFTNNIMTNANAFYVVFQSLDIHVILFPGYPDPFQPNPFMPGLSMEIPLDDYINKPKDHIPPYSLQTTLGIQRQVLNDLSFSADVVWTKGYRLLTFKNDNPAIEGTYTEHEDPTRGNVWVMGDYGKSDYKGLYLNINKRYSNGWGAEISYTLSKSTANVEREQDMPSNYTDPDKDYGPTNRDARHRLAVSGIFDLPLGFQLSSVFYYRSATPYTVVLGYDANKDGINKDYPEGKKRNSARGSNQLFINARLSKFINLGLFNLQVFGEMFNVTDKVNFADYIGNMQSEDFGEPTSASNPQLIQLGFRLSF